MAQKKVFIVHGYEGSPNGGWRPWLMGKLAREDVYACALPMPIPEQPIKEEWIQEIARAVGTPDKNVFLVGHSLGVPAILQYVQSLPAGSEIGGAVLVSGPMREPDPIHYAAIVPFFDPAFDFERIKKVCSNFVVIHGVDDPVVPFSDAEELNQALSCKLVSIPNGGHLNGSSGWYELPAALEALHDCFALVS